MFFGFYLFLTISHVMTWEVRFEKTVGQQKGRHEPKKFGNLWTRTLGLDLVP